MTLSTGRFARACSLETWASVLATHIGLKALRSRRREDRYIERTQDPERESSTFFTDAERQLDARAQLFEVRKHLAEMNPTQATTLFLHDGLGHNLVRDCADDRGERRCGAIATGQGSARARPATRGGQGVQRRPE